MSARAMSSGDGGGGGYGFSNMMPGADGIGTMGRTAGDMMSGAMQAGRTVLETGMNGAKNAMSAMMDGIGRMGRSVDRKR